jgi:hypothetical protein
MSKPERGLPKDFDIKVPDRPVQLGDYLDEPPPVQRAPAPRAPEPIFTPPAEPVRVVAVEPPPPPAVRRGPPPRKQFNMTPETMRMIDELLSHIRTHSAERDVRASELIHALVLAVHEVRPYLDLSHVPPRGKWGSATAAELPVALKDAFQQAVARSRTRY